MGALAFASMKVVDNESLRGSAPYKQSRKAAAVDTMRHVVEEVPCSTACANKFADRWFYPKLGIRVAGTGLRWFDFMPDCVLLAQVVPQNMVISFFLKRQF